MRDSVLNSMTSVLDYPFNGTVSKSNLKQMWRQMVPEDDESSYLVVIGKKLPVPITKADLQASVTQLIGARNNLDKAVDDEDRQHYITLIADYIDSISKWMVGKQGKYTW